MTTEYRQLDQDGLQIPAKIERTREETETLFVEVRRNREERMHRRRNVTDAVKADCQLREGRVQSRVGSR